MRPEALSGAEELLSAAKAGRATAGGAVALLAYWSGEISVYNARGEVAHPTLAAAQALRAEGVAAIWQVASAVLRGDMPGAVAAAARLRALASSLVQLEGAPDPEWEARLAAEAAAEARAAARRSELQPALPPWLATAPATPGYRIERPGAAALSFVAGPPGALGGRCLGCGEPDLLSPGLHDDGGAWWCLDCVGDAAAEPGASTEGVAPAACDACGGSGEVPAPADASVRVTCLACGGRRLALGRTARPLAPPEVELLRSLRARGAEGDPARLGALVSLGLATLAAGARPLPTSHGMAALALAERGQSANTSGVSSPAGASEASLQNASTSDLETPGPAPDAK